MINVNEVDIMSDVNKLTDKDILELWKHGCYATYPDKEEYEIGHDIVALNVSQHCRISYNANMAFMCAEGADEIEIKSLYDYAKIIEPAIQADTGIDHVKWCVSKDVIKYITANKLTRVTGVRACYLYVGEPGDSSYLSTPSKSNYSDLVNIVRDTLKRSKNYTYDLEDEIERAVKDNILNKTYLTLMNNGVVTFAGQLKMYPLRCLEAYNLMAANPYDTINNMGIMIKAMADLTRGSGLPMRVCYDWIDRYTPKDFAKLDCKLLGRWWYI